MKSLHRMNGHLLSIMQRMLGALNVNWEEWIINTIILHPESRESYNMILRTSATLFKGVLYDTKNSPFDEKVSALEGPVPLDKSFAGYCLRTRSIIWVDCLQELKPPDPLSDAYRSFQYVGVSAAAPVSEYVFPIRVKFTFSEVFLGVLNLEWYGATGKRSSELAACRSLVTARLTDLLDLHGVFVATCLGLDGAFPGDGAAALVESALKNLEECHSEALERFEELNRLTSAG